MLAALPVHAAHAAAANHPSSSKKKSISKSRSVKAKPGQKARSKSKAATPAPEFANFTQWQAVDGFIDEMCLDHGFEREALISLFRQIHYLD
ncbi:MAG: lytic murein transglycosylase B, partial [bacterium]